MTRAEKAGRRRASRLAQFNDLVREGMSRADAAKAVRVSIATLWRWQERFNKDGTAGLTSRTHHCGRSSAAAQLPITPAVIDQVQRLAFALNSPEAAWRKFVEQPNCPAAIARFVRPLKTLPPSLLDLARLQKTILIEFRGNNFAATVPLRKAAA